MFAAETSLAVVSAEGLMLIELGRFSRSRLRENVTEGEQPPHNGHLRGELDKGKIPQRRHSELSNHLMVPTN